MRVNRGSFLLPNLCENCKTAIDTKRDPKAFDGTTGQYLCEECREIRDEIDRKIGDGIEAAGYKVYR